MNSVTIQRPIKHVNRSVCAQATIVACFKANWIVDPPGFTVDQRFQERSISLCFLVLELSRHERASHAPRVVHSGRRVCGTFHHPSNRERIVNSDWVTKFKLFFFTIDEHEFKLGSPVIAVVEQLAISFVVAPIVGSP